MKFAHQPGFGVRTVSEAASLAFREEAVAVVVAVAVVAVTVVVEETTTEL